MFFKKNGNSRRRTAAPERELSPRMARLLRESWWLLVVAAFLYLALTLFTYTPTDPGWSRTGSGEVIANRGGVVGAWLADLLLYLFGMSAWWWVVGGVVLVVLGYRRVVEPEHTSDHPLAVGAIGFALVLLASAALESIRLWRLPVALPNKPGGALGDIVGAALQQGVGFNGATLLLLALFAVGTSLLFGVSWLRVMERIGARAAKPPRTAASAGSTRPSASRSSSTCARTPRRMNQWSSFPP
jgi:DNA segregation ATPase FtsK/SpoIIIE, S-DNA-T family